MLVESKVFTPNDVVSLKLNNGDELIAKFDKFENGKIVVKKPLLMVLTQDQTGKPGVQMVPFFMLGSDREGSFPINENLVICMVKSNVDAQKGYTEMTTSLIVPKSNNSIVIE